MDNKKEIDIPFGAFDSELYYQEINIPDGFEATIEDNKIILKRKESEDERIRKWIIGVLSTYEHDRDLRDAAIAWLERQCSQILANSAKTCKDEQKPTEEYNITGIKSKHAQGKLGEMIKKLKPVNEVLEQKPTWTQEDEMMLFSVIWHLRDSVNNGDQSNPAGKLEPWIRTLKERVYAKPKQEWSEWNRILQDASISYLCNLRDEFETKGWDREQIQKCINWLQSLRPQSQWRPSKEQISVLEFVMEDIEKDSIRYAILNSVLEQLKKLREE